MKIEQIIKKCGGAVKVALACELGTDAVKRWRRLGVLPEKYWETVRRKFPDANLDIESLHEMNQLARRRVK